MSASVKKSRRTPAAPPADNRARISDAERASDTIPARQLDVWREAVSLWLSWNLAYEQVTQRLFSAGQDPGKLEEVMDQMDQVRRRAVRLSRQLVE